MSPRFTEMRKSIFLAMFCLAMLVGFYGAALAQDASKYVYTPPPQQPALTPRAATAAPAPLVPAPFGALYNVISGAPPSAPGQQPPLTPFNTAGAQTP